MSAAEVVVPTRRPLELLYGRPRATVEPPALAVIPKSLQSVIDALPSNLTVADALANLAQTDPVIWTMVYRRLKGMSYIFNVEKLLRRIEAERDANGGLPLDKQHDRTYTSTLLRHRPFLAQPLRDQHQHKVYMKGRQTGVSELSITEAFYFLDTNPGTKLIYAFPRDTQLKDFSNTRINEALNETPYMRQLLEGTNQIYAKTVGKSHLILRSAWESNLGEGVDADVVTLDEKDRMKDGVDVAFRESLSSSRYGLFREVSTPTLPGRGVDMTFSLSDQHYWFVKCSKCGMEQTIEYPDNIIQIKDIPLGCKELPENSYDYLCSKVKCRGKLDRYSGRWIQKYPDRNHIRGYHIPQTIAPWISPTKVMQKKLDYKFLQLWENYVLGKTSKGETQLVNEADFARCTTNYKPVTSRTKDWERITVGIDWGNCHDDKTRVLTDSGFKFFRELQKADKVAQWDPDTREMTFVKPLSITVARYNKPLYHFTGKGTDIMVTGNHRMRVCRRGGEWETIPAKELATRGETLLVDSVSWKGREQKTFTLPAQPVSPGYSGATAITIPMNLWLEFVGYYLSEGGLCFDGKRPSCLKMSQRESVNPGKAERIRRCLRRLSALGIKVSEFPNPKTGDVNWTIYGKQLWSWVIEAVGSLCSTKRIPRELLALSPKQLRIIFKALMLGDGSYSKSGGGRYVSTSIGLCEDFQEVCVRLGLRTTVKRHRAAIGNRRALYYVNWSKGRNLFFAKTREHVKQVPYNGKVYCVTVPKEYIVTERNGCVAYQGNTSWIVVLGKNAHNGRTYLLNSWFVEDDPRAELMSVNKIIPMMNAYDPDMIVADAGYGKDRNSKLDRLFPGRFFACGYNPNSKNSRTFIPTWTEASSRVLVDRTMTLKLLCANIKERGIGFPDEANHPMMTLMIKHFLNLAPIREEEDGEIWEEIRAVGDDHLAHSLAYAGLAMDKATDEKTFSFSFL